MSFTFQTAPSATATAPAAVAPAVVAPAVVAQAVVAPAVVAPADGRAGRGRAAVGSPRGPGRIHPATRAQRRHRCHPVPHPGLGAARHAIHYAVKANPHPVLLRALARAGCRFDASPTEVRAALEAGAPASHLVHSNPVARRDHLIEAHALGVRLFVVDSAGEVAKVAEAAPGSSCSCGS